MNKLLSRLGFIPKSAIQDLKTQLASTMAVNAELRESIREKDERIVQLIEDSARHRSAHDAVKEKYDQQLRVAKTVNNALSGLVPTMNGIRK